MYVYRETEPTCWTVGFYDPEGKWIPDEDFMNPEEAAEKTAYLNGGNKTERGSIKMVCPLLAVIDHDMSKLSNCIQERCAWWQVINNQHNEDHGMCGISLLSKMIRR